jgi:hypothetical protein
MSLSKSALVPCFVDVEDATLQSPLSTTSERRGVDRIGDKCHHEDNEIVGESLNQPTKYMWITALGACSPTRMTSVETQVEGSQSIDWLYRLSFRKLPCSQFVGRLLRPLINRPWTTVPFRAVRMVVLLVLSVRVQVSSQACNLGVEMELE